MADKTVVGIDLAGNENNRSGFCILKEEFGQKDIKSKTIFTNQEILQEIEQLKPDLVAIDAPLTNKKEDRKCDKEMKKYGALPLGLLGMQMLANRGYKLASLIKKMNIPVIEVFPRATEKIMGLQRDSLSKSAHQGDAILAALTGFFYLEKKAKEIGDKEGKIVIPKPSRKKPLSPEI
jgi:hypothetical protein